MISRKTLGSFKRDIVVFWFGLVGLKTWKLNGINLFIDRNLMSNQVIEAILRGTYEWPEYKSINHNLDESDVVLEMGTGIGYVSLQCAKVVGGGAMSTLLNRLRKLQPLLLKTST